MDILKIAVFSIIAVVLLMVLKQFNGDVAVALSVGIGVLILVSICDQLYNVVYTFYTFSSDANVNGDAVTCVIKVVGIGYLAEFSNNICVDTGNKNIGEKVLLASRIAILLCVMPIIQNLFEVIKSVTQ